MIDLHCHILPNVDDGARSMSETIELLKKAQNAGFETICFTPHYVEPEYVNTKMQNQDILKQVETKAKEEGISINLLLGNEVFINDKMAEQFENKYISSLADTKYILIELPMYQEMPQEIFEKLIFPIEQKGLKVVIAHPERYVFVQKNPKKILEYFGENMIFQGNYGSIIGAYGRDAQKAMKKLLKDKIIHYLASDVHHSSRCFYDEMEEIKKKLHKIVDNDYFEKLTITNPKLIIENKDL